MKNVQATLTVLVDADGNLIADVDESTAIDRWNDDIGGAWDRKLTLALAVDLPEPVTVKASGGEVAVAVS